MMAEGVEEAAAQAAWERHPMGQCLAARGWSPTPDTLTVGEAARTSLAPPIFTGVIASVYNTEQNNYYTVTWSGSDVFVQTNSTQDTPYSRRVSLDRYKRAGCDPEELGIDVVFDPVGSG